MRRILTAFVFAVFAVGVGTAHATTIPVGTPIPASEVIINFNGSGLDWVYAGPIAPNEFGNGEIQPASYRAAEGWRVATAAEWLGRPAWSDFIRPGFSVSPSDGFSDHTRYRFTTAYWSSIFDHVDLNDYILGHVTDGVNGFLSGVPETIYVRNTQGTDNTVPEPGTVVLLVSGLAMVLGRRLVQRS